MFFDPITFLGYDLYHLAALFLIFSFLGWIVDVIGTSVHDGFYSDRGFLSLPLCPIYGFGAVFMISLLRPFSDNIPLLFLFSMLICTAWELSVGLILKALFNDKWWDYTDELFNFKGLICPKCSLYWGILGIFFFYCLLPLSEYAVDIIPFFAGILLILFIYFLAFVDTLNSLFCAIRKPEKKYIKTSTGFMYNLSQILGKSIANPAIGFVGKFKKLIRRSNNIRRFIR